MRIDRLPDELVALEKRLANRPRVDPEASLRDRSLQSVRMSHLPIRHPTAFMRQNRPWQVAVALALLAVNLSFVLASQPSSTSRYSSAVQIITADRQALRCLELPSEGADR